MFGRFTSKFNSASPEVRASMAYMVCNVIHRSLSFITMPLFTRLLTQTQYGQFSVYMSWMNIFSVFITLNLARDSLAPAMVKFEKDRSGYVAAVQNLTVVLAAVFLALYLPLRGFWNGILKLPTALVCLLAVEVVFQHTQALWYGQRRFEYKYKSVVAVTLLNAISAPVLAYVLILGSEEKGYARIWGYALVTAAVGLGCFISSAVRGRGGMKKEYWVYALRFNLPLIPYYLSQIVFNESDRIMIDRICGTDKAGLYSVAYALAMMLTFALNAINGAYVPWFYGKLKEGRGEENRPMANGIAVVMAFMLMGVIALAPEIITVMAGASYREAIWVVPPVAMSVLLMFYTQLFANVEFYYEEKTLLIWGSIGAALINIALNAWLIPVYGFVAAGYTTLFSYTVFAAANYGAMRAIARRRNEEFRYFDMKALLAIFAVFAALSAAAMALYDLPYLRYAIVAAVLLGLAIERKRVKAFVKTILMRK